MNHRMEGSPLHLNSKTTLSYTTTTSARELLQESWLLGDQSTLAGIRPQSPVCRLFMRGSPLWIMLTFAKGSVYACFTGGLLG